MSFLIAVQFTLTPRLASSSSGTSTSAWMQQVAALNYRIAALVVQGVAWEIIRVAREIIKLKTKIRIKAVTKFFLIILLLSKIAFKILNVLKTGAPL
jgi:hypothetical protein